MMFLNLLKIKEWLSQQPELELGKQPVLTYLFHAKEFPVFNEQGLFGTKQQKGLARSLLRLVLFCDLNKLNET